MSNKKKSIKNLCFLAMSQIVTIAVAIYLPRLYMVEYGSEVNGLLNSLSQFLVYMGLFEAGIGATTLQALYGPVGNENWEATSSILAATNYYYKRTSKMYLAALIILSVGYPLVVESSLNYLFVVGVVFFSGIGNVFLFRYQGTFKLLLQADGKNYIISNISTILNVCTNLAKIILISKGMNVVLVLAVTFLIQLVQILAIVTYTKRNYKSIILSIEPNFTALDQKNYTMIHQLCELVFQHTDIVILTVVCGLKTVSVYSLYKMIISHLEGILSILSNSVNFVLGQTFQNDLEKYKKRIDLFESLYSAIAFALFAVAYFLLIPFVKLYTSGVTDVNYIDVCLPTLFISIALLTSMRVPMLYTINYAGHFKKTTPQSILESAINLFVSIIAVFRLGIYGVLLGTIAALLYRTNNIIIYSNRKILKRTLWRTYSVYIINFMIFAVLQIVFKKVFSEIDNYLDFFVIGFIASVISIMSFLLAQIILVPHCRKAALEFVRKRFIKSI